VTCVATKAGQVLSEGQILLDQLLLPVKDAKGQDVTPADRKQQVSQVDDTVTAVQQRKVRCDELSEVRRLKLQQLLQLRTCERDIEQVCQPVDSISHKRSNSTCHFHCLAGNSTIIFFSTIQPFSICKYKFYYQSIFNCQRCHVHMQGGVAHNMYAIPADYERIFNQQIQILH